MSNRHERRKAAVTLRKKLAKLKTATLDQHLDDTLGRVRAEFERTGEIHPRFECVTDGESFQVPASWPDRQVKGVAPLRKMDQVKGVAPQTDKIKEIWELENWGDDEWAEQVLAEIVFAEAMNVHYVPERNKLYGYVAGYRVRRAPNGLVLVPSDNDEDVFLAVRVERTKRQAFVLGWLRGSEGKLPQFYQKNCWVIPPEALHDMEKLPGKERLPIGW